MTPYQLEESAKAPCTRTMVGLAGCAVATIPVSKRPTNPQIAMTIFIRSSLFLHSAQGSSDAGRHCDQGDRQRGQSLSIFAPMYRPPLRQRNVRDGSFSEVSRDRRCVRFGL